MSHTRHPLLALGPPPGTGPTLPRREFLRLVATALGGAAVLQALPAGRALGHVPGDTFPDGVKAGDPLPDGGAIWTRLAPPPGGGSATMVWSVAVDPALEQVVRGGVAATSGLTGHAITVPVSGLEPDRWYYYGFEHDGVTSPVGRLRTAPAPGKRADHLRYAFASCQQRNDSHYVAHRAIAQEDVDFLIHLGDYVYVSDGGTLTLDDYRGVYHTFHSNPLLQELHASVPLVAVWDDGEFYNGVDRTGDPARLAAARAAWFEHMPVPRPGDDRTHRTLRWGRLAELHLLDTRQYRDPEVPPNASFAGLIDAQDTRTPPCDQVFARGRTTLGKEQKRWLKRRLARGSARWNLIGSSYDMAPWKLQDFDTPELRAEDPDLQRNGGIYVSNEAFDDYQAERRELMKFIARRGVKNVVVCSGHTHFYKASEIMPDFDDANSPVTAVEFVTGSLTADPDPRTIASEDLLHFAEHVMLEANAPYLKQVDLLNQGYALVDVTPEELVCEFRVLDTFDPDATASTFARFRVVAGRRGLEVVA